MQIRHKSEGRSEDIYKCSINDRSKNFEGSSASCSENHERPHREDGESERLRTKHRTKSIADASQPRSRLNQG